MHEIIEKILEEIMEVLRRKTVTAETDNECSITGLIYKDGLREVITQFYINIAEEKIKELEGEMKEAGLYITGKNGGDCINYSREDDDVKRESYNQAKREEIDKWKEIKDLLVKE